jgi:hypothetical protein
VLIPTLFILAASPKAAAPVEPPLPSKAVVLLSNVESQNESDFLKALADANVPLVDLSAMFPAKAMGSGGADLMKQAKDSYDNLDYEASSKQYEQAVLYFSEHPEEADATSLAEAHFFVGVLAVQNGGKAGTAKALGSFGKALVLNGDLTLDANTYGNDLKKIFEKAKTEESNAKAIAVTVTSVPAASEVKLGFKALGLTPLFDAPMLKPGPHVFTFSKLGHENAGMVVEIAADKNTVEGQLKPIPEYAAFKEKGNALTAAMDTKTLPPAAKTLAKEAKARFLIVGKPGTKGTNVEIWDTYTGSRINELGFTDSASMAGSANKLKNYIDSPSLMKPVAEEPVAGDPVYKKWWFWAGVGAVVVGGGVAAGVVASNSSNGKRPFNVVLGIP